MANLYLFLCSALVVLAATTADPDPYFPGGVPGGNQPCYDTDVEGTQGWCEHTDCCQYDFYVSELCPNYPNQVRRRTCGKKRVSLYGCHYTQVKCCYSTNECAAECTAPCGHVVQDLACKILDLYENSKIWLKPEHFNDLGNDPYDGAASLSNIRDTCLKGRRDSGQCS